MVFRTAIQITCFFNSSKSADLLALYKANNPIAIRIIVHINILHSVFFNSFLFIFFLSKHEVF